MSCDAREAENAATVLARLTAYPFGTTEGLDPLDLAARAEVALQLVDDETGLAPVDLLEPPRL
ncbi:hypothetical protein [Streptomyces globisporus]|uniref:hypothetical protein n=1 Tax=Streptomyces globisporus TaxID=1908 RepID=UPI003679D14B